MPGNIDITFTPAFLAALKNARGYEGIESMDPIDPGGHTYMGISRYYWPDWPGWVIVDSYAPGTIYGTHEALNGMVKMFYHENFWMRINGDRVAKISVPVVIELFEAAVNLDPVDAIRFLQTALNMQNRGGLTYPDLVVDGRLGKKTLEALKRYLETSPGTREDNERILLNCMNGEQYIAYKQNPRHEYFRGWFRRV